MIQVRTISREGYESVMFIEPSETIRQTLGNKTSRDDIVRSFERSKVNINERS